MPEPWPLSGVRGGVAGSDAGASCLKAFELIRPGPVEKGANLASGSESVDELGVEPGVIGRVGLCEYLVGMSLKKEDGEEERSRSRAREKDAGLSVTQPDDPPGGGGHFPSGVSKMPLRSARERSRVIVEILEALGATDGQHTWICVVRESPIPNGENTVGGAETRATFGCIGTGIQRHVSPIRLCERVCKSTSFKIGRAHV